MKQACAKKAIEAGRFKFAAVPSGYRALEFLVLIAFLLMASKCAGQATQATPKATTTQPVPRFRFEMEDKTRINGTADWSTLEVDLGFDVIEIPVDKIRSVKRKATQPGTPTDQYVIDMLNRDRYTGQIKTTSVKARFLGGDITLPFDQMLGFRVLPRDGQTVAFNYDGLILHYDFEGDSTKLVKNRVGENHDAEQGSGNSKVDSNFGRVMKFGGKKAIITKYHKDLCPKKFTFSCWLKPSLKNGQYTFVGGMTKHDGWRSGFALVYMQGDKENIYFYVQGYDRQVVKTPLPLNKWTHVAGTFDGRNAILYTNGKPVGTATMPINQSLSYDTDPFSLGGETEDCYWSGEMDDVSLYNRAMNTRDIKELFETSRR